MRDDGALAIANQRPIPPLLPSGFEARKDGKGFRSACPFHAGSNRTAFGMFAHSDGTWMWQCFSGCGRGSTVMFYMRLHGVTGAVAIRELAGDVTPDRVARIAYERTVRARERDANEGREFYFLCEQCGAGRERGAVRPVEFQNRVELLHGLGWHIDEPLMLCPVHA